jgi:hypothetical protein
MGSDVSAYVDYVSKTPGIQRHRFLRELVALSQKMTQAVFVEAIARALRYRIVHLQTFERIAWFCMSQTEHRLPYADVDENFRQILNYLRLWGLLARWDELLAEATRGRFSHERLLKHVLEAEYRSKSDNARKLRRKRAHIPELLEIETFPFTRQPKLDRKRIMSLYDSFDTMTKQQNIVWLGPTGW